MGMGSEAANALARQVLSTISALEDRTTPALRAVRKDVSKQVQAFLAAHPDLYTSSGGNVRLAIHGGDLLTGSLTTPGFATSVHPDWSTMQPLAEPAPRIPLEKAV